MFVENNNVAFFFFFFFFGATGGGGVNEFKRESEQLFFVRRLESKK